MTSLPPRPSRSRRPRIGRRLPDQRRHPGRPWLTVAIVAAGAAPFLLIAAVLALGGGRAGGPAVDERPAVATTAPPAASEPSAAAEEAAGYAAGIREIALAAGQIIELEIKPGITDIREQAYEDAVLKGFSDRWAADFIDLRDGLEAVVPPVGLEESHRLYVQALDRYREVALLMSAVVEAPQDQREPALQRAIELGEATDQIWDQGQDLLAEHLRLLGLDPGQWLPVT